MEGGREGGRESGIMYAPSRNTGLVKDLLPSSTVKIILLSGDSLRAA